MKSAALLQFAALSTAFVLPNAQVNHLRHVQLCDKHGEIVNDVKHAVHNAALEIEDAFDVITDRLRDDFEHYTEKGRHVLDDTLQYAEDAGGKLHHTVQETYFDSKAWLESAAEATEQKMLPMGGDHGHHGHHGHHGKSNRTVYELIASSNYTTELAKLINEYPDIVKALNGTKANYTVFAPTDRAFKKIPKHAPKPSKEFLEKVLLYHVSPDFYPAGRVLVSKTIPTLLELDTLSDKPQPQRLVTNIGLRGLTVNFFSRVVAVNIVRSRPIPRNLTDKSSLAQTVSSTVSTVSCYLPHPESRSSIYCQENSAHWSLALVRLAFSRNSTPPTIMAEPCSRQTTGPSRNSDHASTLSCSASMA